jgi:hypothetical protein
MHPQHQAHAQQLMTTPAAKPTQEMFWSHHSAMVGASPGEAVQKL